MSKIYNLRSKNLTGQTVVSSIVLWREVVGTDAYIAGAVTRITGFQVRTGGNWNIRININSSMYLHTSFKLKYYIVYTV